MARRYRNIYLVMVGDVESSSQMVVRAFRYIRDARHYFNGEIGERRFLAASRRINVAERPVTWIQPVTFDDGEYK